MYEEVVEEEVVEEEVEEEVVVEEKVVEEVEREEREKEEEERRVGRTPGVPALTWRGVMEREDWEESPSAYASTAEASSASISPLWRLF